MLEDIFVIDPQRRYGIPKSDIPQSSPGFSFGRFLRNSHCCDCGLWGWCADVSG